MKAVLIFCTLMVCMVIGLLLYDNSTRISQWKSLSAFEDGRKYITGVWHKGDLVWYRLDDLPVTDSLKALRRKEAEAFKKSLFNDN